MAAPTNAANVKKVLANREPSTHDPNAQHTDEVLQWSACAMLTRGSVPKCSGVTQAWL